jgi:enoyl-[acyl-carrier protein] reductase/trans-2-enoyl-CoA reductase (NAD+)
MKGFIALDAHPVGCARAVQEMARDVEASGGNRLLTEGPIVVLGSSGGYGLPAAVTAAFRYSCPVVGVCLERPAQRGRTATAGWYSVVELHREAARRGRQVISLNADCFADETKERVVEQLKRLGPPSLLIYSVAAPARTDPTSGVTYRSVLRPIDEPFTTKTVKLDSGEIAEVTLEPATEDQIEATVRVMGGDDWARWVDALDGANLISEGFRTVAFDYIGPSATHPIYRSGTIGRAKEHLEATATQLHQRLSSVGGGAWASVNAAAVTQSSAAIPAVPLYLSLLLRVAREAGTFETPTDQIRRLFDHYLAAVEPDVDEQGRIRLDDWELADSLQEEIDRRWMTVTNETFGDLASYHDFHVLFQRLFGFAVPGVDYDEPVQPDVDWPNPDSAG